MPLLDDIRSKNAEIQAQLDFIKSLERSARNPKWVTVDAGYAEMKIMADTATDALVTLVDELKTLVQ